MTEWVHDILTTATPYWPFIAKVLVIWYLGQFFKKRVWTKRRALRGGFWEFMRDTLPVHPLVAGSVWGLCYPSLPAVEFVTSRGGAVTEGLIAAVTAITLHTALEHYADAQVKRNADSKWGSVLSVLRSAVPDRTTVPPSN